MYTQEEIISKFKAIHGDKYDYSKVVFKKTTEKVCIICPEHGEFWQEPHAHLRGRGCPACGIIRRSRAKTLSTQSFIEKAKSIHGDRYDYSKVNYTTTKEKVCIICPEHGEFLQEPHNHLQGMGCPKCGNAEKGVKLTIQEFVEKSNLVHGNKYDYSKVTYVNNRTPVLITCKKHGDFLQSPDVHMSGHGCPKCAVESRIEKQTLNTQDFIKKAKEIHGNKYDYSKTVYVRNDIPITITCPEHGDFVQKPTYHLSGCGCQKCASLFSHYENELADFIASIVGEENIVRNDRDVLTGNELDVYIPFKKLAFEFDGLYWHSEIKKPNKKYHLEKTNECSQKGVQLIHIFEDEWVHKNGICKSRIKSLLGKSDNIIYARKCNVIEIDSHTAKIFFNENHIQGNVAASVIIGLVKNGELLSAMSFGPLRKNLGRKSSENCWELLRFCNKKNYNVVGGASKLLSYFIKEKKPVDIISYADKRWSTGNLYEKIGFKYIHDSEPSYFYVIGDERKNRFGFRKDLLISKYGCTPDDTEHNFCFSHGWYRIYDCGTKLYEWKR